MTLKGKIAFALLLVLCSVQIEICQSLPRKVHRLSVRGLERREIDWQNADGTFVLSGNLGVSLPLAVGIGEEVTCTGDYTECYDFGDYANLDIKEETDSNCTRIEWTSTYARRFEDCYYIDEGAHWYGGNHAYEQRWPMESQAHSESASAITEFGSPSENYWLVSSGVTIHVDEDVPLFTSLNTETGQFCLVAKDVQPYNQRSDLTLRYDVCVGANIKDAHQKTMAKFYEKPTGIPDETMLISPFWSTWAQYKTNVNQTIVLDMAKRVVSEGFLESSHMEIDDHWESCYGEATFSSEKFPDPAAMVQELKEMGFGITLWIHPFININCPSFNTALENNYFVQTQKSKTGIVSWWQGSNAGLIDFTNPDAVAWWSARLELLRTTFGIDAFKFDAGETNFLPAAGKLQNGDEALYPNLFTTKYVEAVSAFGGMIEVRAGRRNQNLPIFTRMFDKDSRFEQNNGLRSMIPSLLHFGLHGYPFVLPDMIGGNAYGDKPSAELFVRWMQVNAFMPAVQFSIVPWDYSAEVVQITQDILGIRQKYKNLIYKAALEAVADGSPINRPMWWADPEDVETYTIDQQYMLGEDIVVAPVVVEGAVERDVYLPRGSWETEDGTAYEGPIWLRNYPAPLNVLPYFFKRI